MSYNIDTWKTKKLKDLTIPLKSFFEHERKDWHPEISSFNLENKEIEMQCGCDQLIIGKLIGDLNYEDSLSFEKFLIQKHNLNNCLIEITDIEMHGEGSGSFMGYIMYNALKQSKGELEAVLVWDGGDNIQKLKVKDGLITVEDIIL